MGPEGAEVAGGQNEADKKMEKLKDRVDARETLELIGKSDTVELYREHKDDYHFGVLITLTNTTTKKTFEFRDGEAMPDLEPGPYRGSILNSRSAFPQEVRYQVVKSDGGEVVQDIGLSHVDVNNLVLEKGQTLRIIVPTPIRPYNHIFFKFGGTSGGLGFARPYPSQDFKPGEFNGGEQFSAAPIAVAFWGMKMAKENPAEAEKIRTEGVAGVRKVLLMQAEDPAVLVLGSRKMAREIAQVFIAQRGKNIEDYRGKQHASFIMQLMKGKTAEALMALSEDEITAEFERRIVEMFLTHVHRSNEGGGYANKTFLQDLKEAQEKVPQWPEISRQATEIYVKNIDLLSKQPLDGKIQGRPVKEVYIQQLNFSINAIDRELQNYATYDADMLKEVSDKLKAEGSSIEKRKGDLATRRKQYVDKKEELSK